MIENHVEFFNNILSLAQSELLELQQLDEYFLLTLPELLGREIYDWQTKKKDYNLWPNSKQLDKLILNLLNHRLKPTTLDIANYYPLDLELTDWLKIIIQQPEMVECPINRDIRASDTDEYIELVVRNYLYVKLDLSMAKQI